VSLSLVYAGGSLVHVVDAAGRIVCSLAAQDTPVGPANAGTAFAAGGGAVLDVPGLAEISVPALEDLLLTVDDPSGTPVENKVTLQRLLGQMLPSICQLRPTTESGVPVSTVDRTAQGAIYLTPYSGKLVSLYDGTRWRLYSTTERSLALTVTSGKNYDIFLYDNAGTLTLELSAAWTTDFVRADALALQDGIPVKSGATTRRWMGTLRASGSNVTEDSIAKRFVWSACNQTLRLLGRNEAATLHAYGTAVWREWNNGVGGPHRFSFVTGEPQVFATGGWVELALLAYCSLSLNDASLEGPAVHANVNAGATRGGLAADYQSTLGFNELVVVELGAGGSAEFNFYNITAGIMG